MTDEMITYRSANAPTHQEWLGYIHMTEGRLNMAFFAPTEDEVKEQMRNFLAKDKAVRDENRAKRAAAARARAAKKLGETA